MFYMLQAGLTGHYNAVSEHLVFVTHLEDVIAVGPVVDIKACLHQLADSGVFISDEASLRIKDLHPAFLHADHFTGNVEVALARIRCDVQYAFGLYRTDLPFHFDSVAQQASFEISNEDRIQTCW